VHLPLSYGPTNKERTSRGARVICHNVGQRTDLFRCEHDSTIRLRRHCRGSRGHCWCGLQMRRGVYSRMESIISSAWLLCYRWGYRRRGFRHCFLRDWRFLHFPPQSGPATTLLRTERRSQYFRVTSARQGSSGQG